MREAAVAIAGCGAITAVGQGVPAFRAALRQNVSGLRADARFNQPRFQSQIVGGIPAGLVPPDHDDPAYFLAATATREALDDAREVLAKVPASRVGLIFSSTKAN